MYWMRYLVVAVLYLPYCEALTDFFQKNRPFDEKADQIIDYEQIFQALNPDDIYISSKEDMSQFSHELPNLLHNLKIKDLTEVPNLRSKYDEKYNHSARYPPLSITSQEKSGRCWIFAFLNLLRSHFAKSHNLMKFEFSQAHFAYWMTVERFNMYFASILRMLEHGVSTDSPIFRTLVRWTLTDGGTWTMAVNVLNKYGLAPKKEFPETIISSDTHQLQQILRRLLVLHTDRIHEAVKSKSPTQGQNAVKNAVSEVQAYITLAYGTPPENFTWIPPKQETNPRSWQTITCVDFFRRHIKPIVDPNEFVSITSDDRVHLKKGRGYITQFSGLFAERPSGFICNTDQKSMEDAIVQSLKRGMPIWIAIDFNRFRSQTQSLLDIHVNDYKLLDGLDYPFLNKSQRLSFRSSFANHAVLLTDVALDETGRPKYYRIENSHGTNGDGKGFMLMSANWFKEYGFEAVVHKSDLAKNSRSCLEEPAMLLPLWDCLGLLVH